jgi:hypothetical protein
MSFERTRTLAVAIAGCFLGGSLYLFPVYQVSLSYSLNRLSVAGCHKRRSRPITPFNSILPCDPYYTGSIEAYIRMATNRDQSMWYVFRHKVLR